MNDPDIFEDFGSDEDEEEQGAVGPLPTFEELYSDEAAGEELSSLLQRDPALADRVAYFNECGIFGRITATAVDKTAIYGNQDKIACFPTCNAYFA